MTQFFTRSILFLAVVLCGPGYAADNTYGVTPEEAAACQADAVRLCQGATDEDDIIACFRAARQRLTPVCRSTFEAGLRNRHMAP